MVSSIPYSENPIRVLGPSGKLTQVEKGLKFIQKESTMFKKEYESPYIVLSPRKGGYY